MSEELKKCPFCGSTKLKLESKRGKVNYYEKDGMIPWQNMKFSIRCNVCHARGGVASADLPIVHLGEYQKKLVETKGKAIAAWNRRVNSGKVD